MFLVSAEHYNTHCTTERKKRKITKRPAEKATVRKWVRILEKKKDKRHRDALKIKAAADYLKKVLPSGVSQLPVAQLAVKQPTLRTIKSEHSLIPVRREKVYETPKIRVDTDSDDDDVVEEYPEEEDVTRFGREKFGSLASPYLTPYIYDTRKLDTQYGIRKEGNEFKIGDSTVTVDTNSNIHIKGRQYEGTEGLLELLTLKNVKRDRITTDDLKNYKDILETTHAHLEGYKPTGNINISKGLKFKSVIAPLFADTKKRGKETALRRKWLTYQ
jgi:hypothetical protein